jgi:hypothetical protein
LFLEELTSHDTFTENGAVSHSTTGEHSLDYFTKAGTYRDRSEMQVAADISAAWGENPELALKTIFYLRSVTRKSKGFFESEKVQKGQGVRDEFMKLIKWVENSHPETLYKNLWLVPVVGTWKDLWYDSSESGYVYYINPLEVYRLVEKGLTDEYNRGLIAKYLPRIRSKSNVKNDRHRRLNDWAKGLCEYLGWSETDYRKFKSNPENTAHLFQRIMCEGLWSNLDFSVISGKALFNLMAQKGKDGKTVFQRHGLEDKYITWLKTQPTAKFTGYVYELFKQVKGGVLPLAQKITYDKQFDGLVDLAKKDEGGIKGNVWCALDTSGSMTSIVDGKTTTAYDVCVSLGIFFSSLNEGAFKDHVIMFDSTSRTLQLSGSFTDKAQQIIKHSTAWGSTNFQSVIDEIVRVRIKNPNIPISDFPETLIVVSDMQFNATGSAQTNYERAMQQLASVGLPKINIIWWWVTGRGKDYTNKSTDKGVTMLGGFDGSTIQLILGGEMETVDAVTGETRKLTPMEQMIKVLDQEVLNQLKVE